MKPGEGIERSAISKRSLKLSELVFRFAERPGARPANLEYLPNLKVAHPQRTDEAGRFVDDRRIFRRIVDFLKIPSSPNAQNRSGVRNCFGVALNETQKS